MNKCIKIMAFTQYLFDQSEMAKKAAQIIDGILRTRFGRLTHIAH